MPLINFENFISGMRLIEITMERSGFLRKCVLVHNKIVDIRPWYMMTGQGTGGNVLAAICSFLIPGLGQLVQGRALAALLFFVVVSTNYFFAALIIPAIIGGIIHLWSILDAAKFKGEA